MSTTPTNLPVPSEKPQDLKFNAGKIDEFVTSMGWTYTDRFGNKHYTIEGINYLAQQVMSAFGYITLDDVDFDTGATISTPNEVLFNPDDNSYYKWSGSFATGPKVVPPNSTPASSGGVGPGKWLNVGDAAVRSDLKTNAGATMIGTSSGKNVQQELDALKGLVTVSLTDYPDLMAACEALRASNGGRVIVDIGNFYAGETNGISKYMDIPNISIVGTKMPTWNNDASELIGGSVIEGKLNVGAHNFSVSDIGFDIGLNVINRRWPGADTTADYPYGGTWDGFAIGQPSQASPLPQWRGFKARNVIGLLKDSATVGHGVLIENVNGGCLEGDIIGVYGVHGVVIKSENMTCDNLKGFMTSVDGVIFKSDTYARGGNVQVNNAVSERELPNCTPHSAPDIAEYGIYFNPETDNFSGPIQVSNIRVRG